ncbi:MAG: pyruvate synthase subunit beta [candidate division Zixibacteria bacterium]|nr:pyruvate synthase subunit beta [candidate division Zixibacteria bacterium]
MACPGCGEKILIRHVLDVLGPETVIICPAGCGAVTDGVFPHSISPVPFLHVPFGATASGAAGVRAGLDMSGREDTTVLAWAGDGATFDIGMGPLSAVAERNENILYICYDNEAYMNTGIQRSSATPPGSWTTTTPAERLKAEPKKNIDFIMAAHKIPYVATCSPAFIDDMKAKVARAKSMTGFRFLHMYSPCPPGWKADPEDSITLARLAVECNMFPLFEIKNGENYNLTYNPTGIPVSEYLELQGRFRYIGNKERGVLQSEADLLYQTLLSYQQGDYKSKVNREK